MSLEVFVVEEEESKAMVEGSSPVTLMVGLVPTDIAANILDLQIKIFFLLSLQYKDIFAQNQEAAWMKIFYLMVAILNNFLNKWVYL